MLAQKLVAVEVEVADQRHADAGALEPLADGRDRRGGLAGLTVMRTSSEPARARACTCAAVPSTSAVSVLGHRLNHDGRTAARRGWRNDTCTENDG